MSDDTKPNYAALARQYNCDYRTIKQAYKDIKCNKDIQTKPQKKRKNKLDPYRAIIQTKSDMNCSAMAIFKFIEKKGFTGKYSIVRDYCAKYRKQRVKKATIRVEHTK